VNNVGSGAGSVTSTPGGIDCGRDVHRGLRRLQHGQPQRRAPTPTATFTGWSGSCSGTGACNISLDGNKTVNRDVHAQTASA